MRGMAWMVLVLTGLAGPALAAAPSEEAVQGLYEGVRKDAAGGHRFEARVVAWGDAAYKIFIREQAAGGQVAKSTLDGKTEGDAVRFAGKIGDGDWTAAYADGAIKGAGPGGGAIEMKRVIRTPPTLGAKPPAGAVVILGMDGKNFDEAVKRKDKEGKEPEWTIVQGGAIVVPKGGFTSKRTFDGSLKFHVEFKCPLRSKERGQGRGNSGVFVPNGQEIQVLDSFGMTTYTGGGCGGLYKYKDPDAFDEFSLASLPPLEWQTYDIEYKVEKKGGKPTGKVFLTVYHNGSKIHDNHEMQKPAKAGAFSFQDHGNPVEYRNIWVQPLPD
ncbi:MAG: DUF1080 domain-containing protein [Planctomycetes bacterium]|nr:DUF1080 domain-containing protein [Planctomycetota bacterium]